MRLFSPNTIAFLDPEARRSIVLQFIEQIELLTPQITDAIAAGDNSCALRLAHKLRGSCLSLGADRLANITKQIEERRQGVDTSDDAAREIEELERVAQETVNALRSATDTAGEIL